MKKFLTAMVCTLLLCLGSCSTVKKTSTSIDVNTPVMAATQADLDVKAQKISYTLQPSKAIRRAGKKAVVEAAVAEALKANGNADVLVGMQYEMKETKNLFGVKKIKYVTVTGYPGTYKNFRPAECCKKESQCHAK